MLALSLRSLKLPRLRARRALRLVPGFALALYLLYVFVGSNSHTVIDGQVYRSSQPGGEAFTAYLRECNIRTVINLRGHCPDFEWYADEAAACAAAGVSQEDVTLSANRLPPPTELRRLIEILDRTQYPILLHCKQGADRTGLASAIVRLLFTDATLNAARRELWPHRGHFPVARTLAMDEFFDRYEAWLASRDHTPALFREWALTVYKPGVAAADLTWVTPPPDALPAKKPFALTLKATNRSDDPWRFTPGTTAGIQLGYRLYDATGQLRHDDVAGLLRATVNPGDSIDLLLAFPGLEPGSYTLRAEMADFTGAAVPIRAKYFYQFGVPPLMAALTVK